MKTIAASIFFVFLATFKFKNSAFKMKLYFVSKIKTFYILFAFACLKLSAQSSQCLTYNQSNPFNPTFSGITAISCGGSTNIVCSVVNSKWYAQASGGSPISTNNSLSVAPLTTTTYYVQREITLTNQTINFNFTGSQQTWTVPNGVYSINVTLNGAGADAGTSSGSSNGIGGLGGKVQGTYGVTPGQLLYVYVGGNPNCIGCAGWNGGGIGEVSANGTYGSSGGGGASDIRVGGTSLSNRVFVAGGGGGGGCYCACCGLGNGGNGGGLNGGDGDYAFGSTWDFNAGLGGSQVSGGQGGISKNNGTLGQGGNGNWYGGGGGGGYYGGGGGNQDIGGGGGSSYASSIATNVLHTPGVNSSNGSVSITYQEVCVSNRIPVTINVNSIQAPTNPTSNSPQCNFVIISRSNSPGAGIAWYWQGTAAIGTNTTLGSGATYTATTSGIYYIRALNSSGCWSASSASVSVTVNQEPSNPSNPTSNSPQCNTVTLSSSSAFTTGITSYWQGTNSTGTSISLGSGTTYNANNSGTYYIRARTAAGCWSSGSGSVIATIAPLSPPTSANNQTICQAGAASVSASPAIGANTIRWYITSTGGTPLFTGLTYNNSFSSTTTLFASSYNNTSLCESVTRIPVTISLTSLTAPSILSNDSVCIGDTSILIASPCVGANTIKWYSAATGGNSIFTGSIFESIFSPSDTVYASSFNSITGCESTTRLPINVFVISLNPPVTTSDVTKCQKESIILNAQPADGANTIRWYISATGGNHIFTGQNYAVNFAIDSIFYSSSFNSSLSCESNTRSPIQVMILPDPIISYTSTTTLYGQNATVNVSLSNGTLPYLFDWNFDGEGDFDDLQNQSSIAPGNYTLVVKDNNGCKTTAFILIESDYNLSFATGISPNNDGKNDTWIILGTQQFDDLEINIYDVFGQCINHQEKNYIPWDGFYNGKLVPEGEYYFIIESLQKKKKITGTITLRY